MVIPSIHGTQKCKIIGWLMVTVHLLSVQLWDAIQRACFVAIPYNMRAFNGNSPEIRNLPRVTSCLISKLDRIYRWIMKCHECNLHQLAGCSHDDQHVLGLRPCHLKQVRAFAHLTAGLELQILRGTQLQGHSRRAPKATVLKNTTEV